MNRMQKKCVIASAGIHVLLVVILFVGPAFLAPKNSPVPDMPLLDFVPFETVDALVSGGGDPNARPPAAQPNVRPQLAAPVIETPQPTPVREPEQKQEPEPEPEAAPEKSHEVTPEKSTEAALEPTPKARKKPQISLKPVIRKGGSGESKAAKEASDRDAREYAEGRQKLARAIGSAANGIPGSIGGSTDVRLFGPGGGGVPYANFLQAVKTVYTRAWVLPDGVTDDNATVAVEVTIGRDGTVLGHRILRSSGNGAVDQSVRATLEAVTYAAPLPRDAKENQRSVSINFNVKAKRLLG